MVKIKKSYQILTGSHLTAEVDFGDGITAHKLAPLGARDRISYMADVLSKIFGKPELGDISRGVWPQLSENRQPALLLRLDRPNGLAENEADDLLAKARKVLSILVGDQLSVVGTIHIDENSEASAEVFF